GARVTFDGQQFPVEAFDQFAKQGVPRWVTNDAVTQKAYDELVQKVCPCIVMVHSQGGSFGFNAALAAPDKIKALVAVEPSGPRARAGPTPPRSTWASSRACRICSYGATSATRSRSGNACRSLPTNIAMPWSRPAARPTCSSCRRWASRATPT